MYIYKKKTREIFKPFSELSIYKFHVRLNIIIKIFSLHVFKYPFGPLKKYAKRYRKKKRKKEEILSFRDGETEQYSENFLD